MKTISRIWFAVGIIIIFFLLRLIPAIQPSRAESLTHVKFGDETINQKGGLDKKFDIKSENLSGDLLFYLPCIMNHNCSGYFDDFSNPTSGWLVGIFGDFIFDYVLYDEEYKIVINSSNSYAFTYPGVQGSDYTVSASLRNPDTVYGSYGILFGVADNWSTLYSLEIFPDGWYGIYRYSYDAGLGEIVLDKIIKEDFSSEIKLGSTVNQLKIDRIDAAIKAYANNQLLASVVDSTYTGNGYIGLIEFSYNQAGVEIRFDNFRVCPAAGSSLIMPDSLLTPSNHLLPSFNTYEMNSLKHSSSD